MLFSSAVFLFLFLPALYLFYMVLPKGQMALKNALLVVASLFFYAYGEPLYILLMIGSVTFNYVFALWIAGASEKRKNLLCALAVAANLAMLGLFKYSPWVMSGLNELTGLSLPVPDLTIPVGISFYTFQILSYVVDVRKGKVEAQKNYVYLLLYISFFPQLITGPIVKYQDIADQILCRTVTAEKCAAGIRRFIMGLGKKIVISNTAAVIVDAAFGGGEISSFFAWTGAVCYCIQLYFDFSGYSDMAIGLAKMFGFDIYENFNYPYSAVSVRDFWKRWHISLTTWFREYVYFPLGGNRRGKARTILNRVFVFFLTGLWHGANITFVVWGLWHGFLMLFEQVVSFDKLTAKKWARPFTRLYTLLTVCVGFVVFRAPSMGAAWQYLGRMFSFSGSPADGLFYLSPYVCLILACGLVLSAPLFPWLKNKWMATERGKALGTVFGSVGTLFVLALCIMLLASSTFNPFIYYNF